MQVQGAAIGHILDEELRASAKSKQGSVATHFNNFSKLSGVGKKLEELTFEDITDDLVGKFANYLVEKATLKCQEGAPLLMWNSIAGYFSAFKMFVVRKFHSRGVPRPLDDSRYKLFTSEMRGKKVELCQSKGEEWVKPHDQASDEDNMALGLCIFWEGSVKGAEFYHLYRAMVNNAGREPAGKYLEGRDDQHPFIIAVRNAYMLAGISDDEFEKMQADVERGFYEANAYSIPDFLQKLGPSNIVDVPANITLRDWILMSNRREQALLHQVFEQRQQLTKVENMLAESREENKKTNAMLVTIMEHLNINPASASEASLPSAMPEVYQFSDIMNAWNNNSLEKVMFKYLFYDAETSYASLADKGPYKSSFSSRKNCMTIFRKYSNTPLVPPPRSVGADTSKWRMETEEAIAEAAQSIKLFLIGKQLIHENESITVTKLTTKKIKDALLEKVTP
ncbi:hypothetical protein CTEN210_14453 [Chaetoceros tenuissimus]|uniref:Phage integrase SAM-like domain-containing protein n=1 Tax=Chaetoceros tenuissimus TaxID=426638 RepID=A0AAD3HBS1_9STRA|nr:hypothetical protein CTEN210_14453 [Chaetoceros tenuissimus]